MAETWTIGRLLNWTADYLKTHGAEAPRLDAEVLLAHARGCQRIELYTAFDAEADDNTRNVMRDLVKQRAKGMPVAYLVGKREFFSLPFRVTSDVLIPRPETEHLLVRLLDLARERELDLARERTGEGAGEGSGTPLSIFDVGTGSGIIAVCAAKHLPAAQVTAIDVSPAALAVAAENAALHRVAERIEFVESDLLAKLPKDTAADFIVSNPPYVTSAEYEKLLPGVKNFEPRGALEAGPQGTEVIERLIPQAAERLRHGGWLLIEISPMLNDAVGKLLAAEPRLQSAPTIKDLAGLPRIAQAKRV